MFSYFLKSYTRKRQIKSVFVKVTQQEQVYKTFSQDCNIALKLTHEITMTSLSCNCKEDNQSTGSIEG